jgi:hypothetical protein
MQVEEDAQTVLARPGESLEDVLPANLLEERLAFPFLNRPKGYWKADPVEACPGDLYEILLRLRNEEEGESDRE